jgi:hypothetical protein
MCYYHAPGLLLMLWGARTESIALDVVGGILFVAATILVPGYMTHYCAERDALSIFNPRLALRRLHMGGVPYWHAWAIAIAALGISFLGLFVLGVGFVVTSVWFWQVAGFSFASVFSQRFELVHAPRPEPTQASLVRGKAGSENVDPSLEP